MRTPKKNLIVFDMDGVIVDVSASYRETVRRTARLFFKGAPGWRSLPDPLFSLHDLAGVKHSGGLNNDWELTYRILSLLMTRIKLPGDIPAAHPWSMHAYGMKHADISALIHFLSVHDAPMRRLLEENGHQNHVFIQHLSGHDVGTGNVIKQIFQEIYLGQRLFRATYHFPARVYTEDGLIDRETLLMAPALLQALAADNVLGIATGRPRAEADYPLDRFNIRPYFKSIYSLDDCLREENRILEKNHKKVARSKPHPFMLDAIATCHENSTSNRYYVGDMPDDMQAASRSRFGFKGIGISVSAPDKAGLHQALEKAGAHYIINDFHELKEILTQ